MKRKNEGRLERKKIGKLKRKKAGKSGRQVVGRKNSGIGPVAVIMGSDSDLPKMQGAMDILNDFSVNYEVRIVSAHRTPEFMLQYASRAHGRGMKVIIAGAGGAAHLPGVVAAVTPLPVIGVPVSSEKLKGLDSLLSIAQMPRGVPVATMAVDNSMNAGLLAIRIIGLQKPTLQRKVLEFQKNQKIKVRKIDAEIRKKFEI